jgi:hypothetical protein
LRREIFIGIFRAVFGTFAELSLAIVAVIREREERTMALIPKARLSPTAQPAEQVETVPDREVIAAADLADHAD